jgi:hypothetical protein
MMKLAKDIKVGDRVKGWNNYIDVTEVFESFQKNGTRLINVIGLRVFKSTKEETAIISHHGEKARKDRQTFKESTKVTVS